MSSRASSASKYVDAQGRTDAELYLMGILDGSIVSGKKMIQLAEKLLPRFKDGYKQWHFDAEAAIRPVEFIERFLCIPSGKLNVPFVMEQYERAWTEIIFGFVDDEGIRQFQYALVEVSRKNGKTSWAAALHIYMLVASGEFAPQNYCLASSKSQASLAHGAVWRMVRQSPLLQKYLRKGIVTERAETGIVCDKNMGYCIPLSKQSSHLDGLDVYFALADELSSWESRANYDLIRQGMAARKAPLLVVISTENFAVDSIWTHEKDYAYQWLDGKIDDDRFVPFLYEQDDRSEVWSGNPEVFKKSNPGLGTVKNLDFLLAQITKAQNDSSYRSTLYIKDFNIRATAASAFLTYEEACNDTPYVFDTTTFRYGICGIDASDTLDLSCCTFLFMKSGDDHIYRKSMYWISEEQVKDNMRGTQRGRDGVPYLEWADRGFLRIVPGNRVDHRCFIEYIEEMADLGLYTRAIGFDRWGMREILPDMKMLVGEQNVIPIAFGAQSLSQPMKQLKSDMKMGRIIDGGNPIDHWCNMNVTGKWDINGSVQPVKLSGPTSRIDGFAALLCAYKVLAFERWDDYQAAIS